MKVYRTLALLLVGLCLQACSTPPGPGGPYCSYWDIEKQRCTAWLFR
jgi:hypothetical protein